MSVNIAMWSGPRNISTAMMYAFGNRDDCLAWDEPFYAYSLVQRGHDHPMRDEIIGSQETDWNRLVERCTADVPQAIFYQKHMTHHLPDQFNDEWLFKLRHAFLIRAPEKVLASYTQKWAEVSLRDIGFVQQAEIFDRVAQRLGYAPPVVEAEMVAAAPEATLRKLCQALDIVFDEAMLTWPSGPKACDGVWAPHWYQSVWRSSGFTPGKHDAIALPTNLQTIADEARPHYLRLKAYALS